MSGWWVGKKRSKRGTPTDLWGDDARADAHRPQSHRNDQRRCTVVQEYRWQSSCTTLDLLEWIDRSTRT